MKQIKGIWFPDSDEHFEHSMHSNGDYQREQFNTALKYIKPEDRGLFIDVGAHVGLWSRMALKNGFKQILSFEPSRVNFECLTKNLEDMSELQQKGSGARGYNCGLSNEHEEVMIALEKSNNSGSISIVPSTCRECGNTISGEKVGLRVFDDMYDRENIPVDFVGKILIKIDVQGYEAKVVRGMTNFIKEYKPIIIVEQMCNGKQDLEATEYLQTLGMKVLETIHKEVILGW